MKHARCAQATLVIAKLDRLSRSVAFLSALMESDVPFVCCDNSQANRFCLHVMAAMAEHEAEMISRRTKEALAARKARGGTMGTPGNLTNDGRAKGSQNSAIVRAERAKAFNGEIVPRVLEFHEKGLSQLAISEELNGLGYKTPRGQAWTQAHISRLLKNGQV